MDERGVSGDPRPATRELGREFSDITVRNAVSQIRGLVAGTSEGKH